MPEKARKLRRGTAHISEILAAGLVKNGELLRYKNRSRELLMVGLARKNGIQCRERSGVSYTQFEQLGGSKLHRPCEHILIPNGRSLQQVIQEFRSGPQPPPPPDSDQQRAQPRTVRDDKSSSAMDGKTVVWSETGTGNECRLCGKHQRLDDEEKPVECASCGVAYHAQCISSTSPIDPKWTCPACSCKKCGIGCLAEKTPHKHSPQHIDSQPTSCPDNKCTIELPGEGYVSLEWLDAVMQTRKFVEEILRKEEMLREAEMDNRLIERVVAESLECRTWEEIHVKLCMRFKGLCLVSKTVSTLRGVLLPGKDIQDEGRMLTEVAKALCEALVTQTKPQIRDVLLQRYSKRQYRPFQELGWEGMPVKRQKVSLDNYEVANWLMQACRDRQMNESNTTRMGGYPYLTSMGFGGFPRPPMWGYGHPLSMEQQYQRMARGFYQYLWQRQRYIMESKMPGMQYGMGVEGYGDPYNGAFGLNRGSVCGTGNGGGLAWPEQCVEDDFRNAVSEQELHCWPQQKSLCNRDQGMDGSFLITGKNTMCGDEMEKPIFSNREPGFNELRTDRLSVPTDRNLGDGDEMGISLATGCNAGGSGKAVVEDHGEIKNRGNEPVRDFQVCGDLPAVDSASPKTRQEGMTPICGKKEKEETEPHVLVDSTDCNRQQKQSVGHPEGDQVDRAMLKNAPLEYHCKKRRVDSGSSGCQKEREIDGCDHNVDPKNLETMQSSQDRALDGTDNKEDLSCKGDVEAVDQNVGSVDVDSESTSTITTTDQMAIDMESTAPGSLHACDDVDEGVASVQFCDCVEDLDPQTQVICAQCGRWVHAGCMTECLRDDWFCSEGCRRISHSLAQINGKGLMQIDRLVDNTPVSWQLVRGAALQEANNCKGFVPNYSSMVQKELIQMLEASKLVLDECLAPIALFGEDNIIPGLVDGTLCKSGADFSNFNTAILWIGKTIVGVCIVRACGVQAAEIPLLAVRPEFRGNKLGRHLLGVLEQELLGIGVERIAMPAIGRSLSKGRSINQKIDSWPLTVGYSLSCMADFPDMAAFRIVHFPGVPTCLKVLSESTVTQFTLFCKETPVRQDTLRALMPEEMRTSKSMDETTEIGQRA